MLGLKLNHVSKSGHWALEAGLDQVPCQESQNGLILEAGLDESQELTGIWDLGRLV